MAVIINEFEVMSETPTNKNQTADKKPDEKGSPKPPSDFEVKKMLERRMERLERVSAH